MLLFVSIGLPHPAGSFAGTAGVGMTVPWLQGLTNADLHQAWAVKLMGQGAADKTPLVLVALAVLEGVYFVNSASLFQVWRAQPPRWARRMCERKE